MIVKIVFAERPQFTLRSLTIKKVFDQKIAHRVCQHNCGQFCEANRHTSQKVCLQLSAPREEKSIFQLLNKTTPYNNCFLQESTHSQIVYVQDHERLMVNMARNFIASSKKITTRARSSARQ